MAATEENINNFIVSIRDAHSVFANKIAKKEILGKTDVFCYRQKIVISNTYMEIIEKFFDQADYSTDNFFTVDEIKEIMLRVNLLLDTNYTIEGL